MKKTFKFLVFNSDRSKLLRLCLDPMAPAIFPAHKELLKVSLSPDISEIISNKNLEFVLQFK